MWLGRDGSRDNEDGQTVTKDDVRSTEARRERERALAAQTVAGGLCVVPKPGKLPRIRCKFSCHSTRIDAPFSLLNTLALLIERRFWAD